MTKQLSPLEALRELKYVHDSECGEDKSVNERFALIETALKALEIIKEKPQTLLKALIYTKYSNYYKSAIEYEEDNYIYTQDEFDLLKEILK